MKFITKSFVRRAVFFISLLILSLLVHQTQKTMDQHKKIRFVNKQAVFLPRGKVLKGLSMGYRGLLGDWLWIKSVLYFGRRIIDHENPYFTYAYNSGTLDKDIRDRHDAYHHQDHPIDDLEIGDENVLQEIPNKIKHIFYRFENRGLVDYVVFPYIFGGIYVLMETGEINAAQALLEKGYHTNTERWEFPFYLGWLQWIYRYDLDKTRQYLTEAVGKKDCPPYVSRLLVGMVRNLNQTDLTILYFESLLESTENPEMREQVEKILEDLRQSAM